MTSTPPPRWLFYIAASLAVCTAALLFLGALVTSMRVGMADTRSFVMPNQAIAEMAQGTQSLGWIIEHTHRLAAWSVGFIGLLAAILFQVKEPRRGVRALAILGVVLIGCQAMLGKYRVQLNDWWGPGLVWIHGCFAQIVFATLVMLATVSSPGWQSRSLGEPASARLRRWSAMCLALVFGQLVLGGMVRNLPSNGMLLSRLHLLGAFVVFAGLAGLIHLAIKEGEGYRMPAFFLMGVLTLQILLGIESLMSWMARYFDPGAAISEPLGILLVRSAHYLGGSLVLAFTVVIAVKARQGVTALVPDVRFNSARTLEGAL